MINLSDKGDYWIHPNTFALASENIRAATSAQLILWLINLNRVQVPLEFRQLVAEELDRRREAGDIGILSQ